jgi:hypothetical protein
MLLGVKKYALFGGKICGGSLIDLGGGGTS